MIRSNRMQAIQIRCPNCGAILAADGDADSVSCSYCGTASRVQRRSRVFQIPMRVAASGPPLVARQVGSRVVMIFVISIVALVLAGVAFGVVMIGKSIRHAIAGSRSWNGLGPPLVIDVNGDGTDDVVGLARNVQDRDSMYLAAYSGKSGDELWVSDRLGSYTEVYQGRVALAGTTVLRADPRANLSAFELKTGKPRWTKSAGEKIVALCAGDAAGEVLVETADKRWTIVSLADGSMKPGPARADRSHHRGRRDADALPPCRSLPTDEDKTVADTDITDVFGDLPDVPGMNVRLQHQRTGGPAVLFGTRSPGSGVPMVAVLDERGAVRWKSEVPATDPLAAKLSDPELEAVGDRDVVIVYEHQDGPPSVTSFELATGKRRWETPIAKGHAIVLTGLALSRTAVMVSTWGSLQLFDRDSGRPLFTIGSLL
jgi:outer membrane protein assembly factor BamB